MRKLQKAAVAAAVLGGFCFISSGTATAQSAYALPADGCKSHDMNIDILGQVGLLNGLAGNLANGEGDPGGQGTHVGSGCGHGHGHGH